MCDNCSQFSGRRQTAPRAGRIAGQQGNLASCSGTQCIIKGVGGAKHRQKMYKKGRNALRTVQTAQRGYPARPMSTSTFNQYANARVPHLHHNNQRVGGRQPVSVG